ncbi:MAG: hypothetical protein JWO06_4076 [Bacteroidota bacterium]|nr:hypothetical protein [Bacteroidota bacterium]
MKKLFFGGIIFMTAYNCSARAPIASSQGSIRPTSSDSIITREVIAGKITSSDFAGNWKGDENCTQMSTPDAVLQIRQNGPKEVLITGFYASSGNVHGTVIGNTVTIAPQLVSDPEFKITIEGVLIISSDHLFLNSNLTVMNNGLKDVCANSYTR